jgi:poly-gamma-glutamate synthesis protein (capsule biosynthesis protein)
VLDWGRAGLIDTVATLQRLRIKTAGAGRALDEARAPAVLDIPGTGRVLVYSFASTTSGTPRAWAATRDTPGVNLLPDLSEASAAHISDEILQARRPRDVIVVSIHWGPNWGYEIPEAQRHFAHALIERAGVSIIHGHSSHHPKAIEMYRNRLILYGCGDFLNDYEGIRGYEDYRDDLPLMYLADLDPAEGDLAALEVVPFQIRRFQLGRPSPQDIDWLRERLNREYLPFGVQVELLSDRRFAVSWPGKGKRDDSIQASSAGLSDPI